MAKLPYSKLGWKNSIGIWYFFENELILDFGGHNGLKQSQNLKLDFKFARVKSASAWLKRCVDFNSDHSFEFCTLTESWQNSKALKLLVTSYCIY